MSTRPSSTDEGLPPGFLELPVAVYDGDPYWIPEDPAMVSMMFGASSPWPGSKVAFSVPGLARVAAFRLPGQVVDGVPCAFFGYYESVGDEEAAAAVLDAVRAWAGAAGAERLYGPINFTTAMPYRLRIGGPPDMYVDEPYNPLSYVGEFESAGFAVTRSYASHDFDPGDIRALVENTVTQREWAGDAGYSMVPLTPELWLGHADELFPLGNEVFAANFAFSPLTRGEFDTHFGERWARRLHPDLSLLCFAADGSVAGVSFVYPHYAPLAAQGAGPDRVSLRDLNFHDHGAANTEVVFKTVGIGTAHRRSGLGMAMAGASSELARAAGVTKLFMGPMREDNPSLAAVRYGWRQQRVYGLYATDL